MGQIEVVEKFMELGESLPVIDVRSPSEFSQGHIPGAVNIPLFNDEERKKVGTTYVQVGHDEAVELGLEIALPKSLSIYRAARDAAPGGEALVHCWRGGMRSSSVASLLEICGIKTHTLSGGYKAYRRHLHASFESEAQLAVIGGMTGSGKTDLLLELKRMGCQVIDLEGLANHMGSAFGGIGRVQPTTEQFENDIFEQWRKFDLDKPVFIEDESVNVGKCVVPEALFKKIRGARLIIIEVPRKERVARIVRDYGELNPDSLINSCNILKKKMGSVIYSEAVAAVQSGDMTTAASHLLDYYDKKYTKGISRRGENTCTITAEPNEPIESFAARVMEVVS